MQAPAADTARRIAWFAGAACLLCCLVPVLGVGGVAGFFSAIGFRDVLVGIAVVAVVGAGTWMVVRRRHRCAGDGCGCQTAGS
ncbi:hypothetical protein [Lentzea aerocolonigenes]|uniref:hypothetical protein n=1 Tax=Lentzea aerocolonigenes TaxID=68170 RepID=UPI000A7FE7DA|nr:hypothetical protein [Lentzea aerocolonigenes]